jgi:succinate-acetate transporter protein
MPDDTSNNAVGSALLICLFLFVLFIVCAECTVGLFFILTIILVLFFLILMLQHWWMMCCDVILTSDSGSDSGSDSDIEAAIVVEKENILLVE